MPDLSVNREIEDAFVEFVLEDPTVKEITVLPASDRETTFVGDEYVFAACPEAPHLGNRIHQARVVVTLATHLQNTPEGTRQRFAKALLNKLSTPERFIVEATALQVCGWHLQTQREASAERTKLDVFELVVGVRRAVVAAG